MVIVFISLNIVLLLMQKDVKEFTLKELHFTLKEWQQFFYMYGDIKKVLSADNDDNTK